METVVDSRSPLVCERIQWEDQEHDGKRQRCVDGGYAGEGEQTQGEPGIRAIATRSGRSPPRLGPPSSLLRMLPRAILTAPSALGIIQTMPQF